MSRRINPTREERALIVRLYDRASYTAVADLVGYYRAVIRRVLAEEGVAIRGRAEAARFGNARRRAAPR